MGRKMSVNATLPYPDGVISLYAANADGGLAMFAKARLAGAEKRT